LSIPAKKLAEFDGGQDWINSPCTFLLNELSKKYFHFDVHIGSFYEDFSQNVD